MLHSQSLLDERVQNELNQVLRRCISSSAQSALIPLPAMANTQMSTRMLPYSNPMCASLTARMPLTGQEILATGA